MIVVIVETVVFIFFFTSILMLIPAAIFTALENDESGSWDFLNSFYYTFITLSTVGFGDMVPGKLHGCKTLFCNLCNYLQALILLLHYILLLFACSQLRH